MPASYPRVSYPRSYCTSVAVVMCVVVCFSEVANAGFTVSHYFRYDKLKCEADKPYCNDCLWATAAEQSGFANGDYTDEDDCRAKNVVRQYYSNMADIMGLFPHTLLSISNKLHQNYFIDLKTKVLINKEGGISGASHLLDHIHMKLQHSRQRYIPKLLKILREEVDLMDIGYKVEGYLAGYDPSVIPVWCHQELSSLHYGILPVYRTIENFNKHKQNNDVVYTDPFYTSNGGYKVTLAIDPNGYGTGSSGKGAQISVYVHLMKGPNDDDLQFPITGIFTVQVLNWQGNNHHIEKSIEIDNNTPVECRERVTTRERATGWGKYNFLSHANLMMTNRQYLDGDMMSFKISFDPIVQTGQPVPSWIHDVQSATPSCTRTLYSYSVYKKTNSIWYSQPFYSSGKGYKLQLFVYANGNGPGKGTHLSVYVVLMKGEHDDTLSWPFNATITVQLLNWTSDNYHKQVVIPHYTAPIEERERIVNNIRAPGGQNYFTGLFISHTKLHNTSDPTVRYITNNNICFRIVDVNIV